MPSLFRILLCLILLTTARAEQLVIISLGKDQKLAVYALDPALGILQLKSTLALDAAPGSMCLNPAGTHLYVAMKGAGSIATFRIDDNATLTPVSESVVGAYASYLSFHPSGKFLFSSYYKAGQIALHRIGENGAPSAKPDQIIKTKPKAHCITCDPSGKTVFVPHTTPELIYTFAFDADTATLTAPNHFALTTDPGTGPRHLWFHPTNGHAYGSNEQGSSASVYFYNDRMPGLSKRQTITTLPAADVEEKKSTSDIEVHPSGKFAYVANRGYNAIASFAIDEDTAKLTPIGHTPTEPVTRSFNISPDGLHLIAAGQSSGNLAIFRIEEDGSLTRKSTVKVGQNPWWVQILER